MNVSLRSVETKSLIIGMADNTITAHELLKPACIGRARKKRRDHRSARAGSKLLHTLPCLYGGLLHDTLALFEEYEKSVHVFNVLLLD